MLLENSMKINAAITNSPAERLTHRPNKSGTNSTNTENTTMYTVPLKFLIDFRYSFSRNAKYATKTTATQEKINGINMESAAIKKIE